jgi:hypothetical protein
MGSRADSIRRPGRGTPEPLWCSLHRVGCEIEAVERRLSQAVGIERRSDCGGLRVRSRCSTVVKISVELRKICRTVSTRGPESRLPGIVRAARRARAGWKCCTAMPPSQRATRASHDEVASPHHGKPPPPRILNTRNRCSPKSRAHERIRCWALANRAPASSHGSYFRMMCSPRECG